MPRLIGRALPATDLVGSGGPSNVDLLTALADWVERGKAPAGLELVQQDTKAPFAVTRSRSHCANGRNGRNGRTTRTAT